MKLLIIGSTKPYALEQTYAKHLRELAIDVELFGAQDLFLNYYQKSLLNKVLYRTSLSRVLNNINKQLIKNVKTGNYDVIWVFKGMEIFPKTLHELKKHGKLLACYNPDHPFKFHARGSGNKNVSNSIELYDIYGTYSLEIEKELKQKYKVPTFILPFGYEQEELKIIPKEEEVNRICFIGFADQPRVDAIKVLVNNNIPVDVYGDKWEDFRSQFKNADLIKVNGPVFNNDYIKTAKKYRAQLNLFRPHNKNSHNMRSFEMPGIGCIMLAPDSEDHRHYFTHNQDVFLYKNAQDMVKWSKHVLSLSYDQAKEIKINAFNNCKNKGYSYHNRSKDLIHSFTTLLSK